MDRYEAHACEGFVEYVPTIEATSIPRQLINLGCCRVVVNKLSATRTSSGTIRHTFLRHVALRNTTTRFEETGENARYDERKKANKKNI